METMGGVVVVASSNSIRPPFLQIGPRPVLNTGGGCCTLKMRKISGWILLFCRNDNFGDKLFYVLGGVLIYTGYRLCIGCAQQQY